ncbi:hypothetical protein D3C74_190120 [compost metagenome]
MNSDMPDIEQYRREHPMDYVKAIEILNSSSNKDEVFRWIYQITRLHIRDVLYKYVSLTDDENLNNLKMQTLSEQKIFLADSRDFNDPFDNKAFYYRNEELKQFDELRPFDGRLGDEIMFNSRAASLSAAGFNSMPMWAHYANNHKGFCIAYNMNEADNLNLKSSTLPIQYTDIRVDITDIMVKTVDYILKQKHRQMSQGSKRILIDDLMIVYTTVFLQNIKQSSWQYEMEFRCSAGNTSIGMPFIKAKPFEIYVGEKCTPIHFDNLFKISHELKVPLYKLEFKEINSAYQLKPKRIN